MKKTKLFLLVAAMLVFAMLLTSCGSVAMNLILNEEYDPSADVYSESESISELKGYSILTNRVEVGWDYDAEEPIYETENVANDEFVVFVKVVVAEDESSSTVSYKVLSLRTGDVVATFAKDKADYDFTLYDGAPMFQVKETLKVEKVVGETTFTTYKTDYMMYDGSGAKLQTSELELAAPTFLADLIVWNGIGYTDEDNGALTQKAEIPEYLMISDAELRIWSDSYYYVEEYDRVVVYDNEFAYVTTWAAPYYAQEVSFNYLNNGNVLVQYSYQVDEDAKKFDYTDAGYGYPAKMELISVLFDVAKGTTKELDLDYYVVDVTPWYWLVDDEAEDATEAEYLASEDFENYALIAPIVNQQLDMQLENIQFVLLSNKVKVGESLKLFDDQYPMLPYKVGETDEGTALFYVDLYAAAAIVDLEGNVIQMINDAEKLTQVGQYFVGETAIYDLTLTEVYNLVANDATVKAMIDNTVFLREETDNGYAIVTLCDGEKDTIFKYDRDAEKHNSFKIVDGADCYYIYKVESGDYVYYNAVGEKLVTTQVELFALAHNAEFGVTVLGSEATETEEATYYVFVD